MIQELLNQIAAVGPVLPGKLELHYNVCGKAGCRCKDPKNPQKHGPYYRLSYSLNGKNSSMFVSNEDADAVNKMTENYKKLRTLTMDLALASIEAVKQKGVNFILEQQFSCPITGSEKKDQLTDESFRKKADKLRTAQVKINDLTKSRDTWKQKCTMLKEKNRELQHQLTAVSNEFVPKREKKN